jgi:hypothetical protein
MSLIADAPAANARVTMGRLALHRHRTMARSWRRIARSRLIVDLVDLPAGRPWIT